MQPNDFQETCDWEAPKTWPGCTVQEHLPSLAQWKPKAMIGVWVDLWGNDEVFLAEAFSICYNHANESKHSTTAAKPSQLHSAMSDLS
jgi:hypothetical protein